MRIAVVGTGYVGLVTGTCFSEMGHDVVCVDIDTAKVEALRMGRIPIYEPGLDELVFTNVEQGRLRFTTDIKRATEESLAIFIAVGTPPMEDGTADLQYVLDVARSIGRHMDGYRIVVDKSTVPVGTAQMVREAVQMTLDERGESHEFDVVSNPEFLREGSAIQDFMEPDRVVIGCDDPRVEVLMRELYASFARDGRPVLCMKTASAEMTKYAANAMLATKISFMNEVAAICDRVGADVEDVRNGIGSDSRIGYRFIHPGIGYGGSCFPKDVKALVSKARSVGYEARILEAVEAVNAQQKRWMVDRVMDYFQGDVAGRFFAVWGLSFKPETDDVREAPSLEIIRALVARGATIRAYDPKAVGEARRYLGGIEGVVYTDTPYDALSGCEALLLVTEWSYFRNPDFDRIRRLLKQPLVFDGRNIYPPALMQRFGFDYFAVGRAPVRAWSSPTHTAEPSA